MQKSYILTSVALIVALITGMLIPANASRISDEQVQQTLSLLDHELRNADNYRKARENRIDSLRSLQANARTESQWFDYTMKIAKLYSAFNNDSALIYYSRGLNRAEAMGADSLSVEFRTRRATYMTISGLINEAVNEFNLVDTLSLSPGLKRTYYSTARQMYSYIASYYGGMLLATYDYWAKLSLEAQKKLLAYISPDSDEYKLNIGEYLFNTHNYSQSRDILLELISRIDEQSADYAIACHILADIANSRGDRNEYLYYLAKSAIADTRLANTEVTSIQELGGLLFELGDTERAHKYLMRAMNNVVESRASVRLLQTSELLAAVEQDHMRQISRWRTRIYVVIAILIASLAALVVALLNLRKQITRLRTLKQTLEEANKTKDVYLSQFLTLCSIYIDKLKEFCKLTARKISAGQVDELYKITKSGKFIEEQSKEFYSVFDDAFLHIYPNFVDEVNALLRPEEQITPAEGELLNSDLRILAFMRLGIDDAMRVAQILNYSVNTIYAYRNKLRNRAINRDTFESDIMAIGTIHDEP